MPAVVIDLEVEYLPGLGYFAVAHQTRLSPPLHGRDDVHSAPVVWFSDTWAGLERKAQELRAQGHAVVARTASTAGGERRA